MPDISRATSRRSFMTHVTAAALGSLTLPTSLSLATPGRNIAPESFLAAVRDGDVTAVTTMLDAEPALLGTRDGRGRSAFAIAYLHGHGAVGAVLVARGFRPDLHESALSLDWERLDTLAAASPEVVNAAHPIGGSALVAAALGGAGGDIWRVYQYAGDPNARPMGTMLPSPLLAALSFADLRQAEMAAAALLANGANADSVEARGNSPLHAAASRGSAAIVEMLIRKGAPAGALDSEGRTPRQRAEEHGYREVARLLEHHDEIPRDHDTSRRAYDVQGRPYAAPNLDDLDVIRRGSVVGAAHFKLDVVEAAIAEDPRFAHSVATTTEGAVEACAHTGQRPIVDFLLEHGAPYSIATATMRGDIDRVRAMVAEDPLRIHERGPHDFALLWYPIIGNRTQPRGRSIEMLELLVGAGADVDRQHHMGTTALHFAVLGGDLEQVAWLLEHGADVNRLSRKFAPTDETPLMIARRREQSEIAKLLEARGGH